MKQVTIDLNKLIEQAIPQVFGSDERNLLDSFLMRCTEHQEVTIDLDAVLVPNDTADGCPF